LTLARHHSREASPGERGLQLGRAQREPIANTVSVYLRLFAEDRGLSRDDVEAAGAEVGERLETVRPDLVEEIAGIAAGAGQPEELLLAVNARTELLAGGDFAAGGGECSVAGVLGEHALLAQNWDFHSDLAASRLLWVVEPPGERWFATFTEAGIVAKTGLSEAGLAVTLNFLASAADGGHEGVPVHVLLRSVLDRCATAADAERLLLQADVTVSACITVAGDGALTAYELSPTSVHALEPAGDGSLAHTNHFLHSGPVDLIAAGPNAASTHERLTRVRAALGGRRGGDPLPIVGELLSRAPAFQREDPQADWLNRSATLATVVYDVGQRRMWIRATDDPGAALDEVPLPARRGAAAERPRPV
jgi:isopenicillin-N N-acyltransferase-like protein